MKFGIPKEIDYGCGFTERRVALSPAGVRELRERGGQVLVEKGAGFEDEEYVAAGADSARTVIVQVNEQMPRALGDSFIHTSRVHAVVESDEPLPELKAVEYNETERKLM